jgi:hypothetical protein
MSVKHKNLLLCVLMSYESAPILYGLWFVIAIG